MRLCRRCVVLNYLLTLRPPVAGSCHTIHNTEYIRSTYSVTNVLYVIIAVAVILTSFQPNSV